MPDTHSGLQQSARPHIRVSVGDETSHLLRRLECVADCCKPLWCRPTLRVPHCGPAPNVHTWIGFWAFSWECMRGIAWDLACWCDLTTFKTDRFWSWSVDFAVKVQFRGPKLLRKRGHYFKKYCTYLVSSCLHEQVGDTIVDGWPQFECNFNVFAIFAIILVIYALWLHVYLTGFWRLRGAAANTNRSLDLLVLHWPIPMQ